MARKIKNETLKKEKKIEFKKHKKTVTENFDDYLLRFSLHKLSVEYQKVFNLHDDVENQILNTPEDKDVKLRFKELKHDVFIEDCWNWKEIVTQTINADIVSSDFYNEIPVIDYNRKKKASQNKDLWKKIANNFTVYFKAFLENYKAVFKDTVKSNHKELEESLKKLLELFAMFDILNKFAKTKDLTIDKKQLKNIRSIITKTDKLFKGYKKILLE